MENLCQQVCELLQEHAIIIHTKYYSLVIINLGKKKLAHREDQL